MGKETPTPTTSALLKKWPVLRRADRDPNCLTKGNLCGKIDREDVAVKRPGVLSEVLRRNVVLEKAPPFPTDGLSFRITPFGV